MEPIIKVDNVSMCFNLSTEKHESLKEYLLAMVQGRLQYDEFYALRDVSLDIMPGDFYLSLIHISEPTRRTPISYAVFCLKKKTLTKKKKKKDI